MERVVFPHSLLSPSSSLRTPTRAEDELVELQWRNGQVVMHSQTHRTWPNPDLVSSHGEPSDPLVDPAMNEDPSPWVQFPGDDPLLRDFYMDFFHGLPIAEPISMEKVRENLEAPTLQAAPAEAQTVVEQIDHQFSEKRSELVPVPTDKEELPPLTSPKVPLTNGTDDSQAEFGDSEVHEVGGSASSAGVYKRKRKDTDESQCPSEEAGDESMVAARDCRRSITARRARATEVHNLSERRRRDRINEKMRALQELIPHCNKTDKASMLDEAIEYLKSLQLQVQMMWMRGFQHPLSPMSLPAFHVPIQLPGVAPANQPILSAPDMHKQHGLPLAALNMANFHGRSHLYAAYPQFQHHMQLPPQRGGQVTSLRPYGFKVMMDGSQMMMPTNEMPSSSPPL